MSLKALNQNSLPFISYELEPEQYRQDWHCPHCQESMCFVDANTRIKHFRHLVDHQCDVEPESEEHLTLKRTMFELFSSHGFNCQYEVRVGNGIADLLVKKINAYAIECQVSSIATDEINRRNMNYANNRLRYFWILHPKHYLTVGRTYEHNNGSESYCYRLKVIEREFMGKPWLYYYNEKTKIPERIDFKAKWSTGGDYDNSGYCSTLFFIKDRHCMYFG